jgi:hypothetical protein
MYDNAGSLLVGRCQTGTGPLPADRLDYLVVSLGAEQPIDVAINHVEVA